MLDDILVLSAIALSLTGFTSWILFFILKVSLAYNIISIATNREVLLKCKWQSIIITLPFLWAMLIGYVNNNTGLLYEVPLFLYAPITFLILFLRPRSSNFVGWLVTLCVSITTYHVIVFFLLFTFGSQSWLGYFQTSTGMSIQPHNGFTKVYTNQATPMGFLIPLLLVMQVRRQTILNFLLLTACFLMALLMARKIILLSLVVTILGIAVYLVSTRSSMKTLITRTILAPLLAILLLPVVSLVDMRVYTQLIIDSPATILFDDLKLSPDFGEGGIELDLYTSFIDGGRIRELRGGRSNRCGIDISIQGSANRGGSIRRNQVILLLDEIYSAPLFGKGAGYVVPNCVRSEVLPWRFELAWLALTMNFGLVGLLLVAGTYIWWVLHAIPALPEKLLPIFSKLRGLKVGPSGQFSAGSLPLIVGSLSFVFNTLTNPYIMSVETLWILFVPYLLFTQFKNVNA